MFMEKWAQRRREERQLIGCIYHALAALDTQPETSRELINGIHALRYQVRGTYYVLYGGTPERDGYNGEQ